MSVLQAIQRFRQRKRAFHGHGYMLQLIYMSISAWEAECMIL